MRTKYPVATIVGAIVFRLIYVWLMAFLWNPFHFNVGQQWFAAIVLFSLDTTQWFSYRATAQLKAITDAAETRSLLTDLLRRAAS